VPAVDCDDMTQPRREGGKKRKRK